MRPLYLVPGAPLAPEFVGAVLVRDLVVDGERWSKGRRLSQADLARLASPGTLIDEGPRASQAGGQPGFTVLGLDEGEMHEDEAGLRLAAAVGGAGVWLRGPPRAASTSWQRSRACSTSERQTWSASTASIRWKCSPCGMARR